MPEIDKLRFRRQTKYFDYDAEAAKPPPSAPLPGILEGPPGPKGPPGDAGDPGPQGEPGYDGAVWFTGEGDPEGGTWTSGGETPEEGDLFLDSGSGNVWKLIDGTWEYLLNLMGPPGPPDGPPGPPGPQGPVGSLWLDGSGIPSASLGTDNDYYLDKATGDVYCKTSGAWSFVRNIVGPIGPRGEPGPQGEKGDKGNVGATGSVGPVGPQGPIGERGPQGEKGDIGTIGPAGTPGSIWHHGTGTPGSALGSNGDYYLNTTTGDVSRKVNGSWTVVDNLMGPAGPQGIQGPTGATGIQGPKGDGGTVWHSSTGTPGNSLGVDGDYHLNTTTGDVSKKVNGSWTVIDNLMGPAGVAGPQGPVGATGSQGIQGTPGSIWYFGMTAPTNGLGVNGDYYLNTTTGDVSRKSGGNWTVIDTLSGPAGPAGPTGEAGATGATGPAGSPGSVWYSGSTAPTSALGVSGDYHFNTATSQVSKKTSGTWAVIATLSGPKGDTGATGEAGPAGAAGASGSIWYSGSTAPASGLGVEGDYHFNTATGAVSKKTSGSWSVIADLTGPAGAKGDKGDTGTAGTNGTNGSVWYNGAGAPAAATGVVGDYYLNTSNGDVYRKTASGWGTAIENLTGPAGASGLTSVTSITGGTSVINSYTSGALVLRSITGVNGVTVSLTGANNVQIDGTNLNTLAGDVTGTVGANTVARIRGTTVSTTAPTTDQALLYNGTSYVPTLVARLDKFQSWTAAQVNPPNTLTVATGVATMDLTARNVAILNLTANTTLNVSNLTSAVAGGSYMLVVKQTGSFTLAWNAAFKFPSGTTPVVTTGAGKTSIFSFISDGTNLFASYQLDY